MWPLRQKRSERLAVFTRIAVHQPFIAVRTDWHAVRTPRANRSKKFIIRSNGSSYAFDKTHQPFERLELSVRENSSAVWTARAIRLRKFFSQIVSIRVVELKWWLVLAVSKFCKSTQPTNWHALVRTEISKRKDKTKRSVAYSAEAFWQRNVLKSLL